MEKATEETLSSEKGSLVENIETCRPFDPVLPTSSKRPRDGGTTNDLSRHSAMETNGSKRSKVEEATHVNGYAEIEEEEPTGKEEAEEGAKSEVARLPRSASYARAATANDPTDSGKAAAAPDTKDERTNMNQACSGMANGGRWRTHQMAEDYVDAVGKLMYPGTRFRPYGYDPPNREYPLEHISVLAFLKSPLRRPSIIEKWSPYEVAVFEGAMLHYGKEFHLVSREIKTKSTKEVIDFYYIWKKTEHYKKWKDQFITDLDLEFALDPPSPGKS
eukprot:scaffold6124_cov122-Cylindrotheca_fusiformis.AAC.30